MVPPQLVHEALDAHGRNSRRIRAFPAVAGVYYVMALSLYPAASYEAVFSAVSSGLAWEAGAPQPAAVSKVAISLLRSRIGAQPLADLLQRCCVPLAELSTHPAAFYRGLRLVGIDGSTFELPDEPEIDQAFVRPEGRQGRAGYPQARCVVLAECATHAIIGAPGPVQFRRVIVLRTAAQAPAAGHVVSGRSRLIWLRVLRTGPCHRCATGLALRFDSQSAGREGVGRRQLPQHDPSRRRQRGRGSRQGHHHARDRLRVARDARCAVALSLDHDAAG